MIVRGMASATSCPASVPVGLRHDQRGAPCTASRPPDSDYDLRGSPPAARWPQAVGLQVGHEIHQELIGVYDGLEVDLVTHDARKFFALLLRKNGYVLEQLLSPLVVHSTLEHEELKETVPGCITRHHRPPLPRLCGHAVEAVGKRTIRRRQNRCCTSTGCC